MLRAVPSYVKPQSVTPAMFSSDSQSTSINRAPCFLRKQVLYISYHIKKLKWLIAESNS
jgi:hypothetical protein